MSDAISSVAASTSQRPASVEDTKPERAVEARAVPAAAQVEKPRRERAEQPGPSPEQKRKELTEAIQRLNEQVRKSSTNLAFSVDDTTDMVVVQVRNAQSGDLIRQIPSETVLRVAHNIEAVKGMLRDEEV